MSDYVQTVLLEKNLPCLESVKRYVNKIKSSTKRRIRNQNLLKFYEEVCARQNLVSALALDCTIGADFDALDGDIFVFQITLDHHYFEIHPTPIQVLPSKNRQVVYKNASDFIMSLAEILLSVFDRTALTIFIMSLLVFVS